MTMGLLQRARESGKCPPALVSERVMEDDGFEVAVLKVLDMKGFVLSDDAEVASNFLSVLQKTASFRTILAPSDDLKKAALVQRRCIVLAFVGSTPNHSKALSRILVDGYLTHVKKWMDEILNGTAGGVDLLLHLLSNIIELPVTKSVVKGSGMGRAVGSIEKHKICAGTPNESAILDRVQRIKDAWNTSVKSRKGQDDGADSKGGAKRELEVASPSLSPSTKRSKTSEDGLKGSSFSSLLKKVSGSGGNESKSSSANGSSAAATKNNGARSAGSIVSQSFAATKKASDGKAKSDKPVTKKRVKWADHFGGAIAVSEIVEGENAVEGGDKTVSWSDRKRRDRLREKELLAKAKKAKLLDDDDDDFDLPKPTQATALWRQPQLLPNRPDVTKPQLNSREVSAQNERIKSVSPARYLTDYDVPSNPVPLSEVEQALDMTSQSAVVAAIPFFVPQQSAPAPTAASSNSYPDTNQIAPANMGSPIAPSSNAAATPDLVQALGLPMFLVGQDAQALQTLASSPSLLSTLVDSNGMYDQPRLMGLVQTLAASQGIPGQQSQQQPPPPQAFGSSQPAGIYGPASTVPSFRQQQPSMMNTSKKNGVRVTSAEGNLHISGFGSGTTQAEIIALFSPYVKVDEVVMKGTFAFVNTSDPVSAKRAKEALNGALLGGMPVRINAAQRKNRDSQPTYGGGPAPSASSYGRQPSGQSFPGSSYGGGSMSAPMGAQTQNPGVPFSNGQGGPVSVPNIDSLRDDRGHAPTKNLFVAGYGPGTTEQEMRELFGQFSTVIGVVLKGSFTFVNTSSREEAVRARDMLGGRLINGGPLRINFAKETGRLGTSFDLTYNASSGPNAHRKKPAPTPSLSYYGRGF